MIDGKAIASELRDRISSAVAVLKEDHGLIPGLAVVIVGEDAASQVYVRNKTRQTREAGMNSYEYKLPEDTSEGELLGEIDRLNNDSNVNGILVQLPLPEHIDESAIIAAISPEKDVDGFHAVNSGRLMIGENGALVPCTPQGCVILAKRHLGSDLSGKHVVVIGRSNIVGKPVAMLLLQENCTVTITHSKTRKLEEICKEADIVIAAVGRAKMVKADWIKPGATVIDVGINRTTNSDGRAKLVGDVDFEEAVEVAGGITPVPGGVGPMTIACLLRNTFKATCHQNNISGIDV
ncbi:bifunctional methylenetetrahydrofolate dehydrogenase/methenyltetrahydrofolate cyclohydrolase FolD [Pseudomaricurvus alkylphenolicus]|uniref:bifunctional methylenetetrahydrofolate dehydrogenase/methenyltetrahydrofolate cyclohydrolase FolD n=1 Tax=Pseudomaricurvus alkylphenolicus TaxID=1306991 RepID=UPI0030B8754B